MTLSRFARFTWGVLAYNVLVILYGAFVRATGSGAGCGAHWPLCNGVVIPRPERIETLIEFAHRATSGLVLVLAVALVVWAWRAYGKGSWVRRGAALAMFFTITEALVGAALVLFGWVADDDSAARAISMMVHLVNTFLLIGSITVTAWWASVGEPESGLRAPAWTGGLWLAGALAMLVLGASGAVTALGDTLFPSGSLAEGLQQDFSPTAHWLVRMRVYHPAIAISVGLYLAAATTLIRRKFTGRGAIPYLEGVTNLLYGLYLTQIVVGLINVGLLAPVWMQILHLLVTNLIWITFVLLGTLVFSGGLRLAVGVPEHQVHDPVREGAK